jgi:hypothetical protein
VEKGKKKHGEKDRAREGVHTDVVKTLPYNSLNTMYIHTPNLVSNTREEARNKRKKKTPPKKKPSPKPDSHPHATFFS